MMIEQNRITLLTQIDEQVKQKEEAIRTLQAEMEAIQIQMQDFEIKAPIDGAMELTDLLNPGDMIQAGAEIGTIVPPNSDSFKIIFMVSNRDIAGIKVGQRIKCKFLALPYQEYGMVDGVVQQISSDMRTDPQSGAKYYQVDASIENKPIKSYKGDESTIKVGMVVEGQVVSGTKTILRWGLEKLNFLDF